jgi:predicted RNA-binding Zn ribbon-like protein
MRLNSDQRLAGALAAIEFLNTRRGGKRGAVDAVDSLRSFDDLTSWATKARLLRRPDVPHPESERARLEMFALSIGLRSAFEAYLVSKKRATRDDLVDRLNEALRGGAATLAAAAVGEGIEAICEFRTNTAANLPAAIAVAILECVQSVRLETIKRCGAEDCIWFFIDSTKNGSRRWCTSELCGARFRARKHYRKLKAME